jgi:hypothetical protein
MGTRAIPLSRLQADLAVTLNKCADSGRPVVVRLPDRRLVTIQALDATQDDSLVDDLLQSNPAFRALLAKSKASPRKLFVPRWAGRKQRT